MIRRPRLLSAGLTIRQSSNVSAPNFGLTLTLAKAREWYSRAADLGPADAASRLGEL
jgi:TPR repeat protein